MTTKQESIFEMANSKGFKFIIDSEPTTDSDIIFEYFGNGWIFRKDGSLYSNVFRFNGRGESIEDLVPEFLISLETFLEEGYGKKRLYEMNLSNEKIFHTDLIEYVIFEWNRRVQEEIDRKLAIYNGWDAYLNP